MADRGKDPTDPRGIRAFILSHVEDHPSDIASLAAAQFGVTRQAVHLHLQVLERDGEIVQEGKTKGASYRLAEILRAFPIAGLDEDQVFRDFVRPILEGLPDNVIRICAYGVTEMVNNAIDHSGSEYVTVLVRKTPTEIRIQISDLGIGIFQKIQRDCRLDDIRTAVFELTKGKLTTDPSKHTGEGIFFTSRMFDNFGLTSGELYLAHQMDGTDWLLHDRDGTSHPAGTIVRLSIRPDSTRTASEVLRRYSDDTTDDFAFSKTHVVVELAKLGEELFVSRSQARRIVARLEKFREVVLDFTNIDEIGPAFADEIFRVFGRQYPKTHLVPVSMNEAVTKMIRRALTHE